jgi:hypothetical protein
MTPLRTISVATGSGLRDFVLGDRRFVISVPWAILRRREPVQDRCKIGNRLDLLFS